MPDATETADAGQGGANSFVRDSVLGVVAGISVSVAGFVSGVIVARTLGVPGTGTIAMAMWLVFVAVTLADSGITGALARFLPDLRDRAEERQAVLSLLLRGFWTATGLGILALAILAVLYRQEAMRSFHLNSLEAVVHFALIGVCFVIHFGSSFGYHYMRGTQRFRGIAVSCIIGALAQIACVLAGSLLFGTAGALVGYIIVGLPMALVTFRAAGNGARLEPELRSRVVHYSGTLWIAGLLSPLLWTRLDLVLVERVGGVTAAGLFAAAASLSALLVQLCMMLCSAVLPHLSSVPVEARTSSSRAAVKAVLFMLFPVAFGTAAVAPRLVPLIYGDDFRAAGLAATILAMATTGSIITIVLSNVLNMLEKNASLVKGGAVGGVLTVILCLALVPAYGIVGAAVARLGAQGTVAAITIHQLNRQQPGTVTGSWFLPIVLASIFCALGAELVLRAFPYDWGLAVAIPAGALCYLIGCRLVVRFDDDDFLVFRQKPNSRMGRAAATLSRLLTA